MTHWANGVTFENKRRCYYNETRTNWSQPWLSQANWNMWSSYLDSSRLCLRLTGNEKMLYLLVPFARMSRYLETGKGAPWRPGWEVYFLAHAQADEVPHNSKLVLAQAWLACTGPVRVLEKGAILRRTNTLTSEWCFLQKKKKRRLFLQAALLQGVLTPIRK